MPPEYPLYTLSEIADYLDCPFRRLAGECRYPGQDDLPLCESVHHFPLACPLEEFPVLVRLVKGDENAA